MRVRGQFQRLSDLDFDVVAGTIMTVARSIAVALTLAMGAVSTAVLVSTSAQAAEAAANKVTTKAVAEPLKKAQEAMKAKQWDAALAGIKQAQASEKKTPFEAYQIDEFLGYVLIQQKKFGEAAPVFERMLNSGFLPAGAGRRSHQDRRAAVFPGEGVQEVGRVGQEVAREESRQRRHVACCSASRTT